MVSSNNDLLNKTNIKKYNKSTKAYEYYLLPTAKELNNN